MSPIRINRILIRECYTFRELGTPGSRCVREGSGMGDAAAGHVTCGKPEHCYRPIRLLLILKTSWTAPGAAAQDATSLMDVQAVRISVTERNA